MLPNDLEKVYVDTYGRFVIYGHSNFAYYLFEIPQYGGDEYYTHKSSDTLEELIQYAETNLT